MSSKRIRPSEMAAIRAVPWRPGDRGTPYSPAANALPDPERQREVEQRAQAAYQQGFAAGKAAGMQQATERLELAASALSRAATELSTCGKRFRADVEQETVKLAVAIARRLLHRELATDPEAIEGLVIASFQKLNAREVHRLRLSPPDAAIVEQHRAMFSFPPGLEIVADAALPPASAIFETDRGEFDASAETQLAEIERGFTDLVRRRAR